jgi:PAS domain S-box-containing protein
MNPPGGPNPEVRTAAEARLWLAALVESSEDAIIGKTLDGTITSWNDAAERFYGYTAAEVLGRPISLLMPPDRPDELPDILRRLAGGECIPPYETVRRRKDGSLLAVSVAISPVKDADGRVIGASAIARDITGQKRLEDELRRRAEELAESDRRKTEFLHMLAHELRNPLSPILNAVQILRLAGGDPQRREEATAMVERQGRHLARLVNDLLDVSRLSRGKVPLQRERLDVARLVRTAVADHRAALDGAQLRFRVTTPETPVWVRGDATRLIQIVGNLLNNAAKFTAPGGEVRVRLTATADGRRAELSVCDTGVGMEPAVLDRLFEPFSQADRTLDRARGGLGLGLALVKGLVELHGGEVVARSGGKDQGAEFLVRLPLEGEPAALSRSPANLARNGNRLRILVVEDNRDAANSLRVLLELLGHQVAVAYSGPEGVSAARQERPDVVLCDIGLPGLNGYGVARALRQDPTTAATRLIAVTGYGSDEDRRLSREAGFDLHLTKPVDPLDLQPLLARPAGGQTRA